jgi:hypothetical protein
MFCCNTSALPKACGIWHEDLALMLQTFKKLLRFFMLDEPPNIHCLFPHIVNYLNIFDWANGILGRDFETTRLCLLDSLEHCKADRLPKHEFIKALFTLYSDEKTHKMGIIVDRRPAETIDIETKDASPPLAIVSSSPLSMSPSPSVERLQAALGKGEKSVTADDRVMIPKFGLRKDLDGLATKGFGSYITLNTLTIHDKRTSVSAPQFAKLLEITHQIAPIYELKGKICYWFALLIFLVVRERTGGTENSGDKIERRGKLWNYTLGGASASVDDEGGVPNHEYERALKDLEASHCHDFIVSSTNPSRLT